MFTVRLKARKNEEEMFTLSTAEGECIKTRENCLLYLRLKAYKNKRGMFTIPETEEM